MSKNGTFPERYPSKLVLIERREKVDPSAPTGISTTSTSWDPSRPLPRIGQSSGEHRQTCNTLAPLVRHFLLFPHPSDRKLPLHLPGIGQLTYAQAFHRLRQKDGWRFEMPRIYFGVILRSGYSFNKYKIIIPMVPENG